MLLDILDCLTAPAGVLTPYAPTAQGSNINTASYIDRITAMDDGAGADLDIIGYVSTTVTSAGSATVRFQLIGNATDPAFGSNNVVLFDSSTAIPKATLVAGYRFLVGKVARSAFKGYANGTGIAGGPVYRYVTVNVIIATADLTAGAFNFWLTGATGTQDNLAYKAGYSV
jgi:hypothetical protein